MRPSLFAAAARAPDAPALLVEGRSLSYGELAEAVASASIDRSQAILPIVADNRLETIVAIWGAIESRIPIGVLHPRSTERERERMRERLASASVPDDAVAVFFTSGTTGTPKGAVLSSGALIAAASASAQNLGWRDGDRWLLTMPIAHVGGFSILIRCALADRTVILEPSFAVDRCLEVLREQRATLVSLVPTMLRRLLAAGLTPTPDLRAILLGGAAAPSELLREARARGLPVFTTYGLTEACSQVTLDGRPLPGTEVRVREGRVEVRGPTMFSGYLGEPERDPHHWFDTGDFGHFDDEGRLLIEGRRANLILSGGENVYPSEVETVLLEHPAIEQACVYGVTDPEWGEVVSAALVAKDDPVDPDALRKFLSERIAGHKRPRKICWVDELVENRAGKVDRRAVREHTSSLLRPL